MEGILWNLQPGQAKGGGQIIKHIFQHWEINSTSLDFCLDDTESLEEVSLALWHHNTHFVNLMRSWHPSEIPDRCSGSIIYSWNPQDCNNTFIYFGNVIFFSFPLSLFFFLFCICTQNFLSSQISHIISHSLFVDLLCLCTFREGLLTRY